MPGRAIQWQARQSETQSFTLLWLRPCTVVRSSDFRCEYMLVWKWILCKSSSPTLSPLEIPNADASCPYKLSECISVWHKRVDAYVASWNVWSIWRMDAQCPSEMPVWTIPVVIKKIPNALAIRCSSLWFRPSTVILFVYFHFVVNCECMFS